MPGKAVAQLKAANEDEWPAQREEEIARNVAVKIRMRSPDKKPRADSKQYRADYAAHARPILIEYCSHGQCANVRRHCRYRKHEIESQLLTITCRRITPRVIVRAILAVDSFSDEDWFESGEPEYDASSEKAV